MKKSRCVIISAGEIRDYARAKSFLREDDFFIFCDGGLLHAKGLGVEPDLIVGDFDSCPKEELERFCKNDVEMIQLPCEKDDTDTFYAVKLALERKFDDFLFLGAMGKRFDHAFANVSILVYLYNQKKSAAIVDDYSLMKIAGQVPVFVEESCSYFSVLTIAGDVSGVTIKNAKYPLENASLSCDFQLGVSNEPVAGKTAEVSVKNGLVLVVEVF